MKLSWGRMCRGGAAPVQDEGGPHRPASIRVQVVDASLSIGEELARARDLELHEALPPVVDAARRAAEHPRQHLQNHVAPFFTAVLCSDLLGTHRNLCSFQKLL